jgi:hypothetical protein
MLEIIWFCLQSFLGVTANGLWWIGNWVLWDELAFGEEKTRFQMLIYFLVGFISLLLNGTLGYECGLDICHKEPSPGRISSIFHVIRFIFSRWCYVIMWIGLYDLFVIEDEDIAWSVLAVSHVFVAWADIAPVSLWRSGLGYPRATPQACFSQTDKSIALAKPIIGIFGEILMWVSLDRLQTNYDDKHQEVLIKFQGILVGLLCMSCTLTMPSFAGLNLINYSLLGFPKITADQISDVKKHQGPQNYFLNILSNNVGLHGQILYWNGVESYIYFFFDHDAAHYLGYVLASLILMSLVGTLAPFSKSCLLVSNSNIINAHDHV